MGDTIEIPIIEICDGWTVDDIETEDDCDDAFALLTKIVAGIETKMDILEAQDQKLTAGYIKAKAALRYKKAALAIVNTKRGRLKRQRSLDDHSYIVGYLTVYHQDILKEAQLYANVQARKALEGK
ncbi:MAG: hypothetical protein AAFX90_10290 [Pseudomonadota bacterium]